MDYFETDVARSDSEYLLDFEEIGDQETLKNGVTRALDGERAGIITQKEG